MRGLRNFGILALIALALVLLPGGGPTVSVILTLLGAAFLVAGYRKTGLLARGVLVEGKRSDAILWTRKLADPAGGEEGEGEEGFDA